jgi:SAM-dependent methyltransferase
LTDSRERFDRLVRDALDAHFAGWDFSYLDERTTAEPLPWEYASIVRAAMRDADSMLDMGTGGGEVLSSFAPFPPHTCATESYAPNIPIARERLEPLGVKVVDTSDDEQRMPFEDEEFALVIDRHTYFDAPEVCRILKPGGRFITQQVGALNFFELNEWLQGDEARPTWDMCTLEWHVTNLKDAGMQVEEAREVRPRVDYLSISAVVYYLRGIPWQVPDFTVEKYIDKLFAMHQHIEANGGLHTRNHRFLIRATKPG